MSRYVYEYMLIPKIPLTKTIIVKGINAAAEKLKTSKQMISKAYSEGFAIKGYYIDQIIKGTG